MKSHCIFSMEIYHTRHPRNWYGNVFKPCRPLQLTIVYNYVGFQGIEELMVMGGISIQITIGWEITKKPHYASSKNHLQLDRSKLEEP